MKEILITATVLIIGILLIRRIFRGRISSRLQYALWLLVALRLLIPVSAQIDLGPLTKLRLMDLVKQVEVSRGDVVERLDEPIPIVVDSQSALYRLIGNDVQKTEMEEALNNMPDDGPSVVFMAGTLRFTWLDVLGSLWMMGMLAVGLWIVVSNIRFSRGLKKTRQPFALPEEEKAYIENIFGRKTSDESDQRGKSSLPQMYLAEEISSPCLYGWPGRETIYLTPDVAKDSDRLRHVLVHELVHKKHGDSFWALLRSALVTVYWFHPLVWVAAACSKRDCELACDETALLLLGEKERIPYGETLLSIITKKGRLSDLVCTATTMTGSGKSVKERIQFIVKKPKVLYAAVAAVLVLTVAVGVFVFTKNPQFNGTTVDPVDGLTVTGADMQIRLPASIGGISGCIVEEENDDVVIYHVEAQREVGRFSRMMTKDALGLVDDGREVMPLGNQGYNYLLRAYLGESQSRTEHTYTPAESVTEHTYTPDTSATQGVLGHEDIYITEGVDGVEGVPGTDSNDDTTYILDEDDTTYIIDEDGSSNPMLSTDWETLPLEEGRDYLPNENIAEEEKVDYLPNETITTTTYLPREVNVDEIDTGCYVYVKADFGKVQEKYREEMDFIDSELQKAAGDVIILSINRNMREKLFDALTENRTPYVGDNAKVGALLEALPLPPTLNRKDGYSLQTVEEPYSLRFSYEMSTDLFTQEDKDMIYFNAAMLFYAIGNVEEITIAVEGPATYVTDSSGTWNASTSFLYTYMQTYMREDMEKELSALRDADYENDEIFRETLSDLHMAIEAYLAESW
ncbi:MAG: DUF4825 domain-containing protein [Lachnospiraceae bacterium]|nr:DUF4825 domain-containing protein [Lachnospiraceae bacterium]